MKILIIQLARLGDIYLSWPLVRALKRRYPDAQIDMLVRPRFKDATIGLSELREVILLPIEEIFTPLLNVPLKIENAEMVLDGFLTELDQKNYNMLINLSYSPSSSFLTSYLTKEETEVFGYSRHSDGFFNPVDDTSAYFYAQGGVHKINRLHLADLFCIMLDIDPIGADWRYPEALQEASDGFNFSVPYLVIHIGASEVEKSVSPYKWRSIVNHLLKEFKKQNNEHLILLVGAANERENGAQIAAGFNETEVFNLVGKTQLQALFPLLQRASLLIGCDSAPSHIASLTGTPQLNISFSHVNFWETGPRSYRSLVLSLEKEEHLISELVAQKAMQILNKEDPKHGDIVYHAGLPGFKIISKEPGHGDANANRAMDINEFSWRLVQSVYMKFDPPPLLWPEIRLALSQLLEVNQLILEQLHFIEQTGDVKRVAEIITRGEEIMNAIASLMVPLKPLVRWMQTEKIRIGPIAGSEILVRTQAVHQQFDAFIKNWLEQSEISIEAEQTDDNEQTASSLKQANG